jgi:erythromycin esterase
VNGSPGVCAGPHVKCFVTAALISVLAGCGSLLDSLANQPAPAPSGGALMYPGSPQGWIGGIGSPPEFEHGRDLSVRKSGSASGYVRSLYQSVDGVGTLVQSIRADAYRGHRVRYSGWIRTSGVGGEGAGLWFRGDGVKIGPFDNMTGRRLTGTKDWQHVSIVVDVPQGTTGVAYGVLLVGPGVIWVDDLRLEVVAETVPVTAPLSERLYSDSAETAALYARLPVRPLNLGFEGEPSAASQPATVAWARNASFPFTTDDPDVPSTDLDPLRPLVGGATIVALGEATHGTREFFRMKHRVLAWLVREMGFSNFGIEASLPEALAVDHYVQTGEGNPRQLLSDLRYWTWNTTEVLAMIEWMRNWNATGQQPRVHFTGVDLGYPGVAIDSVIAFTSRMDPDAGAGVSAAYRCLNDLRDPPPESFQVNFTQYQAQTAEYRASCRAGIRDVDSLFARNTAAWSSVEGAEKFRVMRRLARIVDQSEELLGAAADQGFSLRDQFMAENVAWWRDTHAPGAKMVLWAHNAHISRVPRMMGDHLSRRYGAEYLAMAQTFGTGSFNAVFVSNANVNLDLRSYSVTGLRDESIENVFMAIGLDRLIFDARRLRSDSSAAAEPLQGLLSMRSVGATYRPGNGPTGYQVPYSFRSDYDVIIWFRTATASTLLPYLPR